MNSPNARDRSRSPRFPSQGLPDSLKHLGMIYEGVHNSSIDSATAYQLMGFAGKSGSSAKALGSLRQYGLIDGIGDSTRVSELAMRILEPAAASERADAISEAARNPDVFQDVLRRFDDRVPPADEPIRAYLIRELGFQSKATDGCIKALRQSLAFAEQEGQSIDDETDEDQADEVEATAANNNSEPTPRNREGETKSELVVIPLTKDCRAELRIIGPLSDRAVSNLRRHIDLLAEVWREEDDD